MISPAILQILKNKKIVLGISSGIAIYKICELARLLTKHQAEVHTVMSPNATKMISPTVFEALTGNNTWFDQWQQNQAGKMEHLQLSRRASAILIAPATANTIGKIANGLADNLLTSIILGREKSTPLVLAPAMNAQMWENSIVQKNIKILQKHKVDILSPQVGELACNETGQGRLVEPRDLLLLLTKIINTPKNKSLIGKKILISLGPTFEKIDPVRGITNLSSGKMGIAIAKAAWLGGAEVDVIAGGGIKPFINIDNFGEQNIKWQNVESANEMMKCLINKIKNNKFDAFFSVAAIADFRPLLFKNQKIKKSDIAKVINLELSKTEDIVARIANLNKNRPKKIIGFAAETENIWQNAQQKLQSKSLDYIVANKAELAFNNDNNQVTIYAKSNIKKSSQPYKLKLMPKEIVANEILRFVQI